MSYVSIIFGILVPMLLLSWYVPTQLWTFRYPMWFSLFLMAIMAALYALLFGVSGAVIFDMAFDNNIPLDGPSQQKGEAYFIAIMGWGLCFLLISTCVAVYSGFQYGRANPEMNFETTHKRYHWYGTLVGRLLFKLRQVVWK